MKKRIIQILIIVVVIGVLLIAYNFFFLGDEPVAQNIEREVFTSSASSLDRTEAQELLRTLKSLEDLDLDPALFSTKAFMRLIDFSRSIPKRQVGRDNPFSEINLERETAPLPEETEDEEVEVPEENGS